MNFVTKLDCLTQDEFLALRVLEKSGGIAPCVLDILTRLDALITTQEEKHEEELEALEETHSEALGELNSDVYSWEEKYSDLESKVDELKDELKELQLEVETKDFELSELRDKLNDLDIQMEDNES